MFMSMVVPKQWRRKKCVCHCVCVGGGGGPNEKGRGRKEPKFVFGAKTCGPISIRHLSFLMFDQLCAHTI